ncbi:transposase [Serratia odorifera]|uniref:transposase n=1 Tax=Serratia odorifera TaxID=618 RepID=UPI003531E185
MNKSKFGEKQIHFILSQADKGAKVSDICKIVGISQATFYNWRNRYGLLNPEAREEINRLKEENKKLKCVIKTLEHDKRILQNKMIKKR